jgi:hypothetical protein
MIRSQENSLDVLSPAAVCPAGALRIKENPVKNHAIPLTGVVAQINKQAEKVTAV